jgi:type I restriction enzyme M protein
VLANPPFNVSQWHGELLREDVRWKYGVPPVGNANFAWVQHFIYHLAPGGIAGFVLANGAMSSMQSGEGEIRQRIVEADLVDCIVAMPPQLFYATQIPVSLWCVAKDRTNGRFRNRSGQILFIDARKLGRMETRVHRVLDPEDIERIAGTYHAWRNSEGAYEDVPGFCRSATLEEVQEHGCVLTPGRYVRPHNNQPNNRNYSTRIQELSMSLSTPGS